MISCQKQADANTEEPTELSVSPTEYVLGGGNALYSGGAATIEITTNKAWTATTTDYSRITFMGASSGKAGKSTLGFSFLPYLKERSFVITIAAGELSKSVKVKLLACEWDGSEEDYPFQP